MKILISNMSEEDLPYVLDIETKCFSRPWTEKMFLFELERNKVSRVYTAKLEEKSNLVCGYICIWLFPGEAQIINLAVNPEYQGQGIGKQLIEFALDKIACERIDEVFLEVRASNMPALTLYEKAGFLKIGRRKKYYSDTGEDAFLMKKSILIN